MPHERLGDSPPLLGVQPIVSARVRWVAAALLAFAADLVLHLPITDACDAVVRRVGWVAWDTTLRRAFPALGLAAVIVVGLWPAPARRARVIAFVTLLAGAALAQRVMLVAGIENIHYPQYAMLVGLLSLGGLASERAWLAATMLGAADELYQFLALPRGTPTYFDWNDVLLNAMGAAFGVVLVATFARRKATASSPDGLLPLKPLPIVASFVIIALAMSPPWHAPLMVGIPDGRSFHKLSAPEAWSFLGLLWCGVQVVLTQDDAVRSLSHLPSKRADWRAI